MSSAKLVVLVGGLLVGIVDAIDAFVFFGLRGVSLAAVFRGIAASVLGRQILQSKPTATAVGVLLHFCVAFAIAATFWLIARAIPILLKQWVITGLIFGVVAYFVMNLVVLPIATQGGGVKLGPVMGNGIFIHAVLGLVLADLAKKS